MLMPDLSRNPLLKRGVSREAQTIYAPVSAELSLCGSRLADALLFRLSVTGNVSSHDEMKQNYPRDVKKN